LENIYPIENIDFEIIGTLTEEELAAVTTCFASSASVKQKY
jgi:predicted RNA-binding protein